MNTTQNQNLNLDTQLLRNSTCTKISVSYKYIFGTS